MDYSTNVIRTIREAFYYQPPVQTIGSSQLEDELLQICRSFGDNILAIKNWLLYKVLPDIYKEHIDWFFVKLEDRKSLVGNMRYVPANRLIKNNELPVYKLTKSEQASRYLFIIKKIVVAIREFYEQNPDSKEKPTLSPEVYDSLIFDNKGKLPFLSHRKGSSGPSSLYPIDKVVGAIKKTDPIWTNHEIALDMVGSTSLISTKNVGRFPLFLFDIYSGRWYKSAKIERDQLNDDGSKRSPANIIVNHNNNIADSGGTLQYYIKVSYDKQDEYEDSFSYTVSGSVSISHTGIQIFYEDEKEYRRGFKGSGIHGDMDLDKNIFTCGELVSTLAGSWRWLGK